MQGSMNGRKDKQTLRNISDSSFIRNFVFEYFTYIFLISLIKYILILLASCEAFIDQYLEFLISKTTQYELKVSLTFYLSSKAHPF